MARQTRLLWSGGRRGHEIGRECRASTPGRTYCRIRRLPESASSGADRRGEPASSGFPARGTRRLAGRALPNTGSSWREREPPSRYRACEHASSTPQSLRALALRRAAIVAVAGGRINPCRRSRRLSAAWRRRAPPSVHGRVLVKDGAAPRETVRGRAIKFCQDDRKIRCLRILVRFPRKCQRKSRGLMFPRPLGADQS